MKLHFLRVSFLLTLLGFLSACSVIAGLFPDKQKQYRYGKEIPALEIPPDLSSSSIEGARASARAKQRDVEEAEVPDAMAEEEPTARPSRRAAQPTPTPEPDRPPEKSESQSPAAGEATLIELEEPFSEAWNDVNRALGRLEVEVTDQNRSDGVYYVHYSTGKPANENSGGMWQGVKSWFGAAAADGKRFQIKLEEHGKSTDIYVLEESGKSVTGGAGLDLLKRLSDKLQNLEQPEPGSGSKAP
jgi:uncharacterized lipoprotein